MSKKVEWKSSSFDYDKLNELTHKSLTSQERAKSLISDPKFSEWASKGGKSNIDNLLNWCRENNHWEDLIILQKGVPKTEEVKKKISKTLKGRPLSEETKQKMSESRMGHGWSDETIEKLKKAARKRCTPILQFDLSGNFIKEWSGLAEIHDELGFNKRAIQVVCNNYRDKIEKGSKQSKGFIWKYKQ